MKTQATFDIIRSLGLEVERIDTDRVGTGANAFIDIRRPERLSCACEQGHLVGEFMFESNIEGMVGLGLVEWSDCSATRVRSQRIIGVPRIEDGALDSSSVGDVGRRQDAQRLL